MSMRAIRGLVLTAALLTAVAMSAVACGGSDQTATSATISSTETTTSAPIETSGSMVISGLVDYPMTFTALDMDYMDWVTVTADDPELGSTDYDGVSLSDIFAYTGVQSDAKTVVITAADGATSEVTLADISPDALLAVADDGSLTTVMPGMDSSAWVKDIVALTFK